MRQNQAPGRTRAILAERLGCGAAARLGERARWLGLWLGAVVGGKRGMVGRGGSRGCLLKVRYSSLGQFSELLEKPIDGNPALLVYFPYQETAAR